MTKLGSSSGEQRPVIEWIIGALSAILVLALLGFLLIEGVVRNGARAAFDVRIISIDRLPNGYLARIAVENAGDEPASAVQVEASAQGEAAASVLFDYVAGKGVRYGAFYYAQEPLGLEVRVTGYAVP